MSFLSVAIATALLLAPGISAQTSELTALPENANLKTCKRWLKKQTEAIIDKWAVKSTGEPSKVIGRQRLILYCLGDPPAEIVGFGSSKEFDDRYCAKNRETQICKNRN